MSSSPDSHVKRPHSQQDQVPATSIQPTATHASLDMQSSYFQAISNQLPPGESIISDQPTNQLPTIGQPSMHPSLITDQPTSEMSIGRQTHNLSLITNQFPADIPVTGQLPGNAPVTTGHIPVQFPGNAPVTTGYIPTQHPGIVHWQPAGPLVATGHLSGYLPTVTNQLPANVHATTESLPANMPRTTKKLAPSGTTTTRSLTHIPAPKARTSPSTALPPQPPRRRPMRWIGALVSCLLILLFTVIFVAPLGNNEHGQTIAQTVGNFFSPGSSSTFDPLQHVAPTPALMTTEGYCGGRDIWGTCATAITDSGQMGTGQMQAPITGSTVTQPFAHPEFQTWCNCIKPHSGIDLAAPYGTQITAADSGQVIWVGWDWSGLGWAVKINHGHYIATVYGHLSRYIVSVGQNVTKGQIIGYEGSSGASTGPHLHFMVIVNNKWVDPTTYIQLP